MSLLRECEQKKENCISRTYSGKCVALHDTTFNKKCPFFRSVDSMKREDVVIYRKNYMGISGKDYEDE